MSSTPHPTDDDASSDESTEADHDAETPVNSVRLSESGRQFIIEECVICGERHAHGSQDRTVATGGRSHRASHCHGTNHTGGYYLELDDAEEPPEWWYGWVGVDSEVSA